MYSGVIKMSYQIYRFTWQNIEIEARYNPSQWNVIAHLEIEAINPERAALPITETGYLSHFHEIGSIERDYIILRKVDRASCSNSLRYQSLLFS